ncbi:MAG: hypothetical protein A2939_01950 [Parcubacteria group bacterium RIFCSPLOWO2_01_FULL_48_18]|nr:MAG: hypothetical protein A2939_01950 [Parcubacteria group bacterium RIFCSPLOWO2_01_FULL_48_18]
MALFGNFILFEWLILSLSKEVENLSVEQFKKLASRPRTRADTVRDRQARRACFIVSEQRHFQLTPADFYV